MAYAALAGFFYLSHLLGFVRFPDGDFTEHFVPFAYYLGESLRSGHLPLWNPYTYGGHPFLADVQAAVFYPPQWISILLTLPWNTPGVRAYVLQVEVAGHVVLAGFGVYLLARSLTGDPWAAFVAGATFAFSGYLTGYPPLQTAIMRTAVWLPYVLWGLYKAWQEQPWGWWVAGTGLALAFLGGHPQTFLYIAYVTAAWWLFLGVLDRERWLRWGWGGALVALAVLGLTAAQWWPSLEFTRYSVRAHLTYEEASGGFPLRDTWQLLLPGVLSLYSPLYVGLPSLTLALIALIRAPSWRVSSARLALSPRQGVAFFAVLGGVFLLLSYGRHAFLYAWAYRYLPGWALFRGQERAAYVVALALSLMAGYGALALGDRPTTWRRRYALWLPGGMVVAIGLFGWFYVKAPEGVALFRYVEAAGRATVFLILMAVLLWRGLSVRLMRGLVVALVLADLFLTNMPNNRVAGPAWALTLLPPEAQAIRQAVSEAMDPAQGMPGRVHNEYRIYADYGMIAGVEELWGSSPLRLDRFDRLFHDFPQSRLWDLFGVQYVLTWRREMFEPAVLLGQFPGDRTPDHAPSYLHRLLEPNPRARVVPEIRVVDDDTAWRMLADFQVDLNRIALVPPKAAPVLGAWPEGTPSPAKVRLWRVAPNHVRVRVRSASGGLLVVAENWMPGWRGQLRGEDGTVRHVPVVRADLTLIAVPLPPGTWTVDLVYWPDSVRLGLLISTLSLLGWLVWGWRVRP